MKLFGIIFGVHSPVCFDYEIFLNDFQPYLLQGIAFF